MVGPKLGRVCLLSSFILCAGRMTFDVSAIDTHLCFSAFPVNCREQDESTASVCS